MLFKSLLRSSRIELLTSRALTSVLYAVFALAIWVWWGHVVAQFVWAYFTLREFDVPVGTFFFITIVLFLPLLLIGAFMARTLIQRLRLRQWFRSRVKVPEYTSQQSPAEAGYLVDYSFTINEVCATLLQLHFRNVIQLLISQDGTVIMLRQVRDITEYERALLAALFRDTDRVGITSLQDRRLVAAGMEAHEALTRQLQYRQLLPRDVRPTAALRILARVILWVGGFVGVVASYAYLTAPEEVLNVIYPRYPVAVSELLLLAAMTGLALFVVVRAWWPRFSEDQYHSTSQAWMQAAGFQYYVRTVFRDRLAPGNLTTQTPQTVALYAPYMVAFGLVPVTLAYLQETIMHVRDTPGAKQ